MTLGDGPSRNLWRFVGCVFCLFSSDLLLYMSSYPGEMVGVVRSPCVLGGSLRKTKAPSRPVLKALRRMSMFDLLYLSFALFWSRKRVAEPWICPFKLNLSSKKVRVHLAVIMMMMMMMMVVMVMVMERANPENPKEW